jgi:MFS family permease
MSALDDMNAAAAPAGEAPYPPPSRAWWVVAIFAVAAVLQYTDRQILSLLVDPIRAELGLSDTQISVLQGAGFAVLYSLIGLPLGRAADMLPRRNLIIAGILLWSLATAACGLATDYLQLLLCRICVGIGEAALAPAAVSMIADYFPPTRRGTAIGAFLTGQGVGGGAAITIGGFVLALAEGGSFSALPLLGGLAPWRIVLILVGLPGIPVAALLLTTAEPARRRAAAAGHALPLSQVYQGFRARAASLAPLYIATALLSVGDYGLLAWSPALLSRNFAFGPAEIGAVLGGLAMATSFIATIGAGWVADRLARKGGAAARLRFVYLSSFAGVFGACVGFAPDATTALAVLTIWMLMSSATATVAITAMLELLPNEMRGIGTSMAAFCNTILGLGLGPTLVALATDHIFAAESAVGLAMTLVVLPAVFIAILLYYCAFRVVAARPQLSSAEA